MIFAEGLLAVQALSCSTASTFKFGTALWSSTAFCSKDHKGDQFSKHPHTKPKLPNRPEPVCQKFSAKEREVRTRTQRSFSWRASWCPAPCSGRSLPFDYCYSSGDAIAVVPARCYYCYRILALSCVHQFCLSRKHSPHALRALLHGNQAL